MNDGKAANWKEYYLDTLEDPNTGMPCFPTLVMFLADVQDAVNRLEMLRQGKKTAKELNTEFYRLLDKLGWTEKPHLTISTLLGITERR
jgi:hypothetical protein